MIELRPHAKLLAVREILGELAREIGNIRGAGGSATERLNNWREWSARASSRARGQLTEKSIRELVLGPHYAMLQSLDSGGYGPGLAALIDPELSTRHEDLVEALKELDAAAASWGSDRLAIILDTNVLLAAGPRVAKIDWDKLLRDGLGRAVFTIPIQVVEELDRLKDRGPDKQRDQARYALKWLDSLSLYGDRSEPFETTSPSTTIRVWVDENNRIPLAEVDRDIIDRALQLAPFTKQTLIASMDRSMVMRARTYGLAAALLDADDIPQRSP